jgi:hypothetical protein
MARAAKKANGKYIEAGYGDKVVFRPKKKGRHRPPALATWKRSQGLWATHPVLQGMTVKAVIEWFRGEDCDV